jgi:hypothetical protein
MIGKTITIAVRDHVPLLIDIVEMGHCVDRYHMLKSRTFFISLVNHLSEFYLCDNPFCVFCSSFLYMLITQLQFLVYAACTPNHLVAAEV